MERFPSGQREQTVNLLSVTSVVRIHPSPPRKSTSQDVLFSCSKGVDYGCFFEKTAARYFACEPPFGADACAFEQVQHCAIKRIHPSPPRKSVLFGTDFLLLDNPLPFSSIFVVLPRRKSLLSVHTRTKTPATIPQIVCLLSKRRCAFLYPFIFV